MAIVYCSIKRNEMTTDQNIMISVDGEKPISLQEFIKAEDADADEMWIEEIRSMEVGDSIMSDGYVIDRIA